MKKKPLPSAKLPLASGVPVYCTFTKIVPAAELADKLWKGNMKKHPASNLDAAHAVVVGDGKHAGNGWRRPVVVSSFSGMVTKGNGMVQMALRHNLDVPIEIQSYKSRREEIRDLIADNALPKHSTDDKAALKKLLGELDQDELAMTAVTSDDIDALLSESEEIAAEFPITAKLHESYDYVLVFTDNESDFAFLQTLCGIQTERSYKKTGVGLGRCIDFKRFLSALRENHHSINVARGHDDHAPARSRRTGVRAKKPGR